MNNAHASPLAAAGELRKRGRHPLRERFAWSVEHRAQILASIAVATLVLGGVLYAVGEGETAQLVWRPPIHDITNRMKWWGPRKRPRTRLIFGRAQHQPGRGQALLSNVGALRAVMCGVQLCAIQTSHASLVGVSTSRRFRRSRWRAVPWPPRPTRARFRPGRAG